VIYIEANSGAVKRVGRSDAYATEFDLEAEECVALPKGEVHKRKEVVQVGTFMSLCLSLCVTGCVTVCMTMCVTVSVCQYAPLSVSLCHRAIMSAGCDAARSGRGQRPASGCHCVTLWLCQYATLSLCHCVTMSLCDCESRM